MHNGKMFLMQNKWLLYISVLERGRGKTVKSTARPSTRLPPITVCQRWHREGLSHPDYSAVSGSLFKKGTGGCNLSLPHKCPNRHVLRSLSNNCWVNKEQQIEGEARERTSHRYMTTHNRTRTRRLSAFWVTSVRAMDGEEERRRGRKSAFVFTWAWSVEIRWLSRNTCCRDNAMPLRHCCRLKTLRESRRWVRAYSRQSYHFQEV